MMVHRLAAVLLALAACLTAQAQEVSPYCPPGAKLIFVEGGPVCTVPAVNCKSPQVQICTDALRCTCEAVEAARPCTATVVYPVGKPAGAMLVPMEPWCDANGAAAALAAMLSRLLGAP